MLLSEPLVPNIMKRATLPSMSSTGALEGKLISVGTIEVGRKRKNMASRGPVPKTPSERTHFRCEVKKRRLDPPRFRGQTTLEKLAVSAPVAVDYSKRMHELKTFASKNKLRMTKKNLDEVCCRFVNNLFDQGFDLQDGSKTMAAVIDSRPDFSPRHMLQRTRRALQGWSKVEPQFTRPPLPWRDQERPWTCRSRTW